MGEVDISVADGSRDFAHLPGKTNDFAGFFDFEVAELEHFVRERKRAVVLLD